MALVRNFTLPAGIGLSADYVAIYGTNQATTVGTGSIVSFGGIGVSGNIYLGGNLSVGTSVIAGTWAGNAVTGRYGGTGYTTYTKGDLLVGAGSTFIRVGTGYSHQVISPVASTSSGVGWTDLSLSASISTCYGSFYSTVTQTVYGANTITPLTYNNTFEAANMSIYGGAGTSSRILISSSGVYNIQFSAQINLTTGTQPKVGDFWFRINGTDVPWSNTKQTILGKDSQALIALNFVSTINAGQYFEIMMNSNDAAFSIEGTGATTGPVRPGTPSIITTVTKVL
jgi:hypothetical protein